MYHLNIKVTIVNGTEFNILLRKKRWESYFCIINSKFDLSIPLVVSF